MDAALRRRIVLVRLEAAVVDCELSEVCQDAERQFRGPRVRSQMERGVSFLLYVDGRLLGFNEKKRKTCARRQF